MLECGIRVAGSELECYDGGFLGGVLRCANGEGAAVVAVHPAQQYIVV